MRSDFAELLACALMPLLVSAGVQLCGLTENRWRSQARATAVFALVFAAIWLSNAPAGLLASYSVAILFCVGSDGSKVAGAAVARRERTGAGLWIGKLLSLPAAYEQRWVNISQVLSSGLLPSQNFLYTLIEDPEHNAFNWIASNVAILLIVLTGVAGLAARRKAIREQETGESEKLWRVLMLLAAAATVLMIRVSSFFGPISPSCASYNFHGAGW